MDRGGDCRFRLSHYRADATLDADFDVGQRACRKFHHIGNDKRASGRLLRLTFLHPSGVGDVASKVEGGATGKQRIAHFRSERFFLVLAVFSKNKWDRSALQRAAARVPADSTALSV